MCTCTSSRVSGRVDYIFSININNHIQFLFKHNLSTPNRNDYKQGPHQGFDIIGRCIETVIQVNTLHASHASSRGGYPNNYIDVVARKIQVTKHKFNTIYC